MSMFAKRHYEAIAAVVRDVFDPFNVGGHRGSREIHPSTLANAFADMLARDSARFDRARFLKACGVQGTSNG